GRGSDRALVGRRSASSHGASRLGRCSLASPSSSLLAAEAAALGAYVAVFMNTSTKLKRLVRSAIYVIARKEFLKIRRDRRTLVVIVTLPIMMLLIYGFGIRYDVTSVPMAVADFDRSQASHDFLDRFFASGYFVRVDTADSYARLERDLDSGRARIAVVIPPEFRRKVTLREKVRLQALVDGTDNNTASIALGYFNSITQ